MSTLIQLPGGFTALLRDSDELSNRSIKELRRALQRVGVLTSKLKERGFLEVQEVAKDEAADAAAKEAANTKAVEILSAFSDDEVDNMDLFQRACVVVRLIEWSLDAPIPTTPDEVDDLPRPIYVKLTTEAAKLDLSESFGMENATDPKAATEDSDNSSPSSEEPSS